MSNYTFTHGSFSTTVRTDFEVVYKKIQQYDKKFARVTTKYAKQYAIEPIQDYIKKLILSGGSPVRKYSWGYWYSGASGFKYAKGKSSWFSTSFRGKDRQQRYPIHPKSYFLRKKRTRPKAGQFALIDTKEMMKSFMVLGTLSSSSENIVVFGNISRKFEIHEFGKDVPQRMTLTPAIEWFEENKALKEKMLTEILKEFEKI